MDALTHLADGFAVAFQLDNLLWALFGVFMGNIVGVLPGLGVLAAISMLLPLTYSMTPTAALIMLSGIYYGSQYGGGITAIMLNLPGTPSHAVTCLDGNPLAKKGLAGSALFMMIFASFCGASVGIVIMTLFSPLLVSVASKFGPAEYFSMMLLGILAGSMLAKGSALKGLTMVVLGLVLGVVGTDVNTGIMRFTFGFIQLADGLQIVALAMGLFGLSDFLRQVNQMGDAGTKPLGRVTAKSLKPQKGDVRRSAKPIARGSLIGSIFGVLPGTGPTIAGFIGYAFEKKISKNSKQFGEGAIEGVAVSESANNSAVQTGFIPTLSLGIPGDPVMALMMGALIMHGIQPGPHIVTEHSDMFWGLIASFWVGNLLLLVLNLPLISLWVRMLTVPFKYLYPVAMFFICIGVYSTNNNLSDVYMVLFFGVAGYILTLLDFEPAPLLLGFVLGPIIEENFRRTLLLSDGDLSAFIDRPISAGFIYLSLFLLLFLTLSYFRQQYRERSRRAMFAQQPVET